MKKLSLEQYIGSDGYSINGRIGEIKKKSNLKYENSICNLESKNLTKPFQFKATLYEFNYYDQTSLILIINCDNSSVGQLKSNINSDTHFTLKVGSDIFEGLIRYNSLNEFIMHNYKVNGALYITDV